MHRLKTSRSRQKALSTLSPFELKDSLIQLAADNSRRSTAAMLNAGRGNPNWIATEARAAFFLLGRFALGESRRVWDAGMLAGMPGKKGIARRLAAFLAANGAEPGAAFLRKVHRYGVRTKGYDADAWIHELTDSIIGDNYPVPDRMLEHVEGVVHDYLLKEMCAGRPPRGRYDLFAVEGGTAAMCYVFDSLMQNGLLEKGDSVALLLPTFTPYIEICQLERFGFEVVPIQASATRGDGTHTWHYPDSELDKLAERRIKLLTLVNPSNPPSVALSPRERRRIVDLVKTKNPGLMVVTDDVYGTFVPGFRSLMAEIPRNTIGVYSFSKNFGCTGWRLGVIALHRDNVFDEKIGKLPEAWKRRLDRRYGSLSLEPRRIRFIDRMVADSRCVALNHTAGLSLPQQVQMCFFALTHLFDRDDAYKKLTMAICRRRRDMLFEGLGLPPPPEDPLRAWYYVELDLIVWAQSQYGQGFVDYMTSNFEPVDFLFRVAELSSVVLLDGGGFGGPKWSVRISLANLDDADYARIGRYMRAAAREYVAGWKAGGARAGRRPAARAPR